MTTQIIVYIDSPSDRDSEEVEGWLVEALANDEHVSGYSIQHTEWQADDSPNVGEPGYGQPDPNDVESDPSLAVETNFVTFDESGRRLPDANAQCVCGHWQTEHVDPQASTFGTGDAPTSMCLATLSCDCMVYQPD